MEFQDALMMVILLGGAILLLLLIWATLVRRRTQGPDTPPPALDAIRNARIEPDEFAAAPISEQIEEMVKQRLKHHEDLAAMRLDFATAADGSLQVWIGDHCYSRVEDIPDARVRDAVSAAVAEFNR